MTDSGPEDAGPDERSADLDAIDRQFKKGQSAYDRYFRHGSPEDLEEALTALRLALGGTGHPGRSLHLATLGKVLRERGDDPALLDESVELLTEATRIASDDALRADHLSDLGSALRTRSVRQGSLPDLDRGVEVSREALRIGSSDHVRRAVHLANLGSSLRARYARTGTIDDLDEAVQVGEEALIALPADAPARPATLSVLGVSLRQRYLHTGHLADLDRAVETGWAAVELLGQAPHPYRGAMLSNVAGSLRLRFERTGSLTDLDRAVETAQAAVDATPEGHHNERAMFGALGNARLSRYRSSGRSEDLDLGVAACRAAVSTIADTHAEFPGYLGNLSDGLQERFRRAGNLADIDEAVRADQRSVELAPPDHPNRPRFLSNLGISLLARAESTDREEDLTEAIVVAQEAVRTATSTNSEQAIYLAHLGRALLTRFERHGRLSDLDEALRAGRTAVSITAPGHLHQALCLSMLARALRARFEVTRNPDHLREALDMAAQTAAAPLVSPSLRVAAVRLHADLVWSGRSDPRAAAELYQQAVELLSSTVAPRFLGWADQEHLLSSHAGLVADAVAAHLQAGDVRAAVSTAELGRGIILSYALEDRSDLSQLRRRSTTLANRFERVLLTLNAAPPDGAVTDLRSPLRAPGLAVRAWAARREAAAEEHEQILEEIRRLPGMAGFLRPPSADDLIRAAAPGPVVLINLSDHRCDAIVLRGGHAPAVIELADLTSADARRRTTQLLDAADDHRPLAGQLALRRTIAEILPWLWKTVALPVLTDLGFCADLPLGGSLPRVWWVPTGPLSALPLHAAQPVSGPGALDLVVSSYAPTIRSLLAAQTPERTGEPPAHLVVAMPTTPELVDRPAQPDLPGAEAEAEAVATSGPPLIGHQSTVRAVCEALPTSAWVHLACHATSELKEPSRGRLLLADGDLEIPTIARLRAPDAELAYLSACSTAAGNLTHADEVISVATAFRIAGYRHVVATLWAIGDVVAGQSAKDFYATLSRTDGVLDAGTALHAVVRALRQNRPGQPQLWAPLVHIGP